MTKAITTKTTDCRSALWRATPLSPGYGMRSVIRSKAHISKVLCKLKSCDGNEKIFCTPARTYRIKSPLITSEAYQMYLYELE